MSNILKINLTLVGALISIMLSCGGVIWFASQKVTTIDEVKAMAQEMKVDMKAVSRTVEQLDTRTTMIMRQQDTMESRLHGIATSIGMRAATVDR